MSQDVYIINVNQTQPVVMQCEQMQPVLGGLATLYPFQFTATADGQKVYNFLTDATVSPVLTTAPRSVQLVAASGLVQAPYTYSAGVLTVSDAIAERIVAGDTVSGLYADFVPLQETNDHADLNHLDYASSGHIGFAASTHTHSIADEFQGFKFAGSDGTYDGEATTFDVYSTYGVALGFVISLAIDGVAKCAISGDFALSGDGKTISVPVAIPSGSVVAGTGVLA